MPMIYRYKSLLTKLMLVLLCIAVSFMIYNQTVRTPHIDASTENGSLAVDFTLSDLQGHSHSLTDYAGRGVVVNFWSTYCPPCEKEMPAIESAYQDYKQQGIEVLAVNVEETMRVVHPFVSKKEISFPVLLDRHGEVFSDYEGLTLPITFFIDEKGKIVERVSGEMTEQMIRTNMEKIKPNSNK